MPIERGKRGIDWEDIRKDFASLTDEEPRDAPAKRVLCSDESCIGLVGTDGRCRVCGRVSKRRAQTSSEADAQHTVESEPEPEPAAEEDSEAEDLDDEETFEEAGKGLNDRILCSDGSCIGVVGRDGYCKICGLKWKSKGYRDDETGVYRDGEED